MIRQFTLLLALALAVPALAVDTAPATTSAPATSPAPNWDTPQAAMFTFYRALANQDAKVMHQTIAWAKDADGEQFLAFAELAAEATPTPRALHDFGEAILKQYPDEDALKYANDLDKMSRQIETNLNKAVDAMTKAVSEGDIKIEGDFAAVTPKGADKVIKLQKVAGKWLLLPESTGMAITPANDTERKQNARAMATTKRMVAVRQELYDQYKKDLAAHKFASGKEAIVALHRVDEEIARRIMEDQNDTTNP